MGLLVIVPSILAFLVSFLAFWLLVPLLLALVFIFAERFPLCAVYLLLLLDHLQLSLPLSFFIIRISDTAQFLDAEVYLAPALIFLLQLKLYLL